ncbi:ATP/GTP-binding protein [Amycolatopsis sp. NPDC088138]|uniref:AAA family ATPase n=1 Tax=Amycolatopsis sp. NPDC088138 TaxID=3363938 RepID=UPI0037FCD345
MLRSFRLGNHRSFRDEQELLLMPAMPGDERPAVPVAAVYGANASGKSNLFKAMTLVMGAVLNRHLPNPAGRHDIVAVQDPFRLYPRAEPRPSTFVFELIAEGIPYTYGFLLDGNEIVEEWLYSYPEKRKRVVFERDRGVIKFGTTVADSKPKLDVLEELIRPAALFLSVCDRLELGPLMPVYRWFSAGLLVNGLSGGWFDSGFVQWAVGDYLLRNPESRQRMVSLLGAADVGIVDVVVAERRDSARRFTGEFGLELKLLHGRAREPFDFDDESSGTRNWIGLLPQVLLALDEGRVLLVDEIDASLHPLLTAELVGLFQDPELNTKGAQLIFTTHDTSLLGTMLGEQVLDRDQIWFVDRDAEGASSLYPLSDFKPRKDQNTERRYLAGSYGAVPVLGDFAEALRSR